LHNIVKQLLLTHISMTSHTIHTFSVLRSQDACVYSMQNNKVTWRQRLATCNATGCMHAERAMLLSPWMSRLH